MKHAFIPSKMEKSKPLIDDPDLSRYVPRTDWLSETNLMRMLRTYRCVYVKPDVGSGGNGVIRIRRDTDTICIISRGHTARSCSFFDVAKQLRRWLRPGRKYLVQQGIELATYRSRPFDIRVVLRRPAYRWRLGWMVAKVAPRPSSVVTNVVKGATDMSLRRVLRGADQPLNVPKTMRKLSEASYHIARKLGSRFPLQIVGLDMAIDKNSKIWIIEANTRPNFNGSNKLSQGQYLRFLRARH